MFFIRNFIIQLFKMVLLQRLLQLQLVRYIIAAGTAFTVDIVVYFIALHFFVTDQSITLFGNVIELRAAMLSLVVSFTCGLFTNYYMSKLFVFKSAENNNRKNFIRFVMVALVTFVGNYFLMRFFLEIAHFYPTPARFIAACIFSIFSFGMHKFFSFK